MKSRTGEERTGDGYTVVMREKEWHSTELHRRKEITIALHSVITHVMPYHAMS